jgi:hypothetical protein
LAVAGLAVAAMAVVVWAKAGSGATAVATVELMGVEGETVAASAAALHQRTS